MNLLLGRLALHYVFGASMLGSAGREIPPVWFGMAKPGEWDGGISLSARKNYGTSAAQGPRSRHGAAQVPGRGIVRLCLR